MIKQLIITTAAVLLGLIAIKTSVHILALLIDNPVVHLVTSSGVVVWLIFITIYLLTKHIRDFRSAPQPEFPRISISRAIKTERSFSPPHQNHEEANTFERNQTYIRNKFGY